MLKAVRRQVHTIIVIGVSAALVVVGVAAAQGGGGSESGEPGGGKKGAPHGAGPMLGPPMKGVTYAEFHVVDKEGEASVVRLDQGKVKSVDASSITLVERDESEVTIAVDSDTKVVGKPGSELSLEDLKEGQRVIVCGPKGGTAKTVALAPKKGGHKGGEKGGMRQGGPGGRQGGPGGGADQSS